MAIRDRLSASATIRRLFLPLLRHMDLVLATRHSLTRRKFYLRTWLHKGYWYYGASREKDEISAFRSMIEKGDRVLEVGGHIGYLSQYFEEQIGREGRLVVVEPADENRTLLSRNVRPDTVVLPYAVCEPEGETEFFTEEYGGFSNSISRDFTESCRAGLSKTQVEDAREISSALTQSVTLDAIADKYDFWPDFLKIDGEGAELRVLEGGTRVLHWAKGAMIAVSRDHEEVMQVMKNAGFNASFPNGSPVERGQEIAGNIFFRKAAIQVTDPQ